MHNLRVVEAGDGASEEAQGLRAQDLASRLSELDPDLSVIIPGREGGFHSVTALGIALISFNVNSDPDFGPHEVDPGGQNARPAVVLRWSNHHAAPALETIPADPAAGSEDLDLTASPESGSAPVLASDGATDTHPLKATAGLYGETGERSLRWIIAHWGKTIAATPGRLMAAIAAYGAANISRQYHKLDNED